MPEMRTGAHAVSDSSYVYVITRNGSVVAVVPLDDERKAFGILERLCEEHRARFVQDSRYVVAHPSYHWKIVRTPVVAA
jgi:hypothetical protein